MEDEGAEVRVSKLTMVSPLSNVDLEKAHEFSTAVAGSQHYREP